MSTIPANEEWRVGDWAEKHFNLKGWATLDPKERQKWLDAYDEISAEIYCEHQLQEVSELDAKVEGLEEDIQKLEEEAGCLECTNDDLKGEIEGLKEKIEELEPELEDVENNNVKEENRKTT